MALESNKERKKKERKKDSQVSPIKKFCALYDEALLKM
jgi:hypothetical protein